MVGSGSLPPGVPHDFYARAAAIAQSLGAKFCLDTSGPPLAAAMEQGVYLIKPNLSEMSELIGVELKSERDWLFKARALLDRAKVEVIALSLGHLGALIVTRNLALRARGLALKPLSAVGAGDSFLGALVFGLASGANFEDTLRLSMAAGAAALINQGTELCHTVDAYRLSDEVQIEPV